MMTALGECRAFMLRDVQLLREDCGVTERDLSEGHRLIEVQTIDARYGDLVILEVIDGTMSPMKGQRLIEDQPVGDEQGEFILLMNGRFKYRFRLLSTGEEPCTLLITVLLLMIDFGDAENSPGRRIVGLGI